MTTVEALRDVGLTLLIMEVRTRLRAGVHADAVARWIDAEMIAASRRVDAVEDGSFFSPESP